MSVEIRIGDALDKLREMPDESVHCCVTSPPYFGLRDYGVDGQIGLEETPDDYVSKLVAVFAEVHRALRNDGTLWLNLGDSYAGSWGAQSRGDDYPGTLDGGSTLSARQISEHPSRNNTGSQKRTPGCKPKDLIGIPWMVAFALRADGWFLRRDIIWSKPNPMPESVKDRPTTAHEYVFLLSKSDQYWYDAGAIREPSLSPDHKRSTISPVPSAVPGAKSHGGLRKQHLKRSRGETARHAGLDTNHQSLDAYGRGFGRNSRSVWTIATKPFPEAHFATFPSELAERCILAGCPECGTVIDPFGGAGTTGLAADRLQRNAILIELNPEYAEMAKKRIRGDSPLFADVA